MISGFTFVHNALEGGYPIKEAIQAVQPYVDEIVVVDMESTDNTRQLLNCLAQIQIPETKLPCACKSCDWYGYIADCEKNKYYAIGAHKFGCPKCYTKIDIPTIAEIKIIDGKWGTQAGETLKAAYRKHIECDGDTIIHFEADEVFDDRLIRQIRKRIDDGFTDLAVYRLQLEANFQRCRWYPEPVHRIFGKWSGTVKAGHTTNRHQIATVIGPEHGHLWDITNCFRDHWLQRVENQAELWHGKPTYLMTPLHTLHESMLNGVKARSKLMEEHWTWTETPFNIPEILKPLVGKTTYRPSD